MTMIWNPLDRIPHGCEMTITPGALDAWPIRVSHRTEAAPSEAETRANAIREAVTWLAMNCHEWAPEALAGEMARALLGDKK